MTGCDVGDSVDDVRCRADYDGGIVGCAVAVSGSDTADTTDAAALACVSAVTTFCSSTRSVSAFSTFAGMGVSALSTFSRFGCGRGITAEETGAGGSGAEDGDCENGLLHFC